MSRWVLLNLTAFTARSQAPTFRRRESSCAFAAKPDDLESGEEGPCVSERLPPSAHIGLAAPRRKLCRSRQVECAASGADTAVEPRTGGAAAQVFLFLRCQVVVVVAPNSFAGFPSGVAQRCQNQPQEGGILARVTAGAVTADCVSSSLGRGLRPLQQYTLFVNRPVLCRLWTHKKKTYSGIVW